MSEKARLKDDTKKQVLALLVSCTAPLTIQELKRDFHDFMGKPLPYRDFGYDTAEDFFKDIPDTVYPTWKNGLMVLEAVSNDSVRHIEKLVSKQKVDPRKQKKYQVYRRGPPSRSSRPPHRARPQPLVAYHVPVYVRNQIKMLFKSYKDGLPLTHFETAYSRRFGTHINFTRLGFTSLRHLLSMIPDVVTLQELQGGEWRVLDSSLRAHSVPKPLLQTPVSSMSLPQPVQSSRAPLLQTPVSSMSLPQPFQSSRAPRASVPDRSQFQYEEPSRFQYEEPRHAVAPEARAERPAKSAPPPKGRGKRNRANSGSSERKPGPVLLPESIDLGGSCSSSENSFVFGDDNGISERVQEDVRKVLESKPKGIWASRLPFEFKNFHGKELSFQDLGFLSVIEFVSALPDIIRIERPTPKGDWLLTDVRIPKPAEVQKITELKQEPKEIAPPRERHKSQKAVDDALKVTIRQVLLSKPDGILLGEFPTVFENVTGRPLPSVESLGFPRLDSFLLSLTDTVLQLSYKGEGRIMLFALDSGDIPYPSAQQEEIKGPEELQPESEPVARQRNIPQDAVGPGTHYRFQPLPQSFESYMEVYISNVVSPGLFWLHLRGKSTTIALENVMDDLERVYYSAESSFYHMPDNLVQVGQICATLFPEDRNWHRCIITAIESADFIQVYFVDYGNTCCVPRDSLRLLKNKYMKLPGQAIQARLANIAPTQEKWSLAARNCMLNICRQKPLIALITSIKDCVLSVCLVDTTTEKDIHINDLLVHEKYAYLYLDEENPELAKPLRHKEIPDYSYVYGWARQTSQELAEGVTVEGSTVTEQTAGSSLAKCCYVQENVLCGGDFVVHLVNLEGSPFLLSGEISSFFWDADLLTSMLRQKRSKANKCTIKREDYPQLFEELEQFGVKSVCDGQTTKHIITLYELHSVPSILETFSHQSSRLCSDVRDLIDQFDPNDPYWKGEGGAEADMEEESQEDQDEDGEDLLSPEDLKVTLQALQFKRKRILQSMLCPTGTATDIVNELNDVEVQILAIKEMLDYKGCEQGTVSSPEGQAATRDEPQQLQIYTPSDQVTDAPVSPAQTAQAIAGATAKTGTGIKTNIVAPMQQSSPSKLKPTPQDCSQSASTLTSSTNQNLIDSFAQQQMLYQSMLASQVGMQGLNPQLMNPQLMASVMPSMMFPFMQGSAMTGQGMAPALTMPGMGTQQMSSLNMLNAQGLGGLGPTLPALGRGQPLSNNMSLLPGLLPLLETFNLNPGPLTGLGRGSGQGQGSQSGSNQN